MCMRKWFIDSINEPMCCNCKFGFSDSFMTEKFPKSWLIGAYRKSRKEVLLDHQRSLFPQTMLIINNMKKIERENIEIKRLRALEIEDKKLYYQMTQTLLYQTDISDNEYMELGKLSVLVRKGRLVKNAEKKSTEKKVFQLNCSGTDCKGFITKEDPTCSICETTTCMKCFMTVQNDSTHKCNSDDIESAKAILSQSKQCPGCHIFIHKIIGCDQMWCTQCHTAFSYLTGEVQKGPIHNPHYYEMRQQLSLNVNQRNPGDIPCGGFPNMIGYSEKVVNFVRMANHIADVTLRKLQQKINVDNITLKYRINLMLKKISEKDFTKQLIRIDNDRRINTHYHDILRTLVDIGVDITHNNADNELDILLSKTIDMTNKALKNTASIFNRKPMQLLKYNELTYRLNKFFT